MCGEQERALIKHPHVDPSRVVLVGRSFGGLIAPRGASGEHRLAAMIVDPGQLEMGSTVMNRLGDMGRPPRPVAEFFHQYRAEFT